MTATDDLPDDIPHLKALIARQHAEIAHLKLWVAKLRRHRFGRRSERAGQRLDPLELQLEELEVGAAEIDARIDAPRSHPASEPAPVSRALPTHLPREVHVHSPEAAVCPDCGGPLKPLGEDVSEVLDYVPSHFRVIGHVRPKRACARCDRIVQAPGSRSADRAGLGGTGVAGTRLGLEVFGSFAALSPVGNLRPLGCRSAALDPGRLGGGSGRPAAAPGLGRAPARLERPRGSRR